MPKRTTSISARLPNPLSSSFLVTNSSTMGATKKPKVKHANSSWTVQQDISSLPNIPLYHIPSVTCTTLDDANPRNITDRIVIAAANLSCVGEYYDTEAFAILQSTTDDIKISINLYKNEKNKILVELNRVTGDVIKYHYVANRILQAANNANCCLHEKHDISFKMKSAPTPTVSCRNSKGQGEIADHADTILVGNSTLENIQNLMKKDRADAVILGMESLAILTGSSCSKSEVRLLASKAVLCDDGPWQDIKNTLFGLIMDCEAVKFQDEEEGSCCMVDTTFSEYNDKLRHALTIVGNSARVIREQHAKNEDDTTCTAIEQLDLKSLKSLLWSLKDYVKEASSLLSNTARTQTLYQASRCVFQIIQLLEECKSDILDIGVVEEMGKMFSEGGCCDENKLIANVSQEIVTFLSRKTSTITSHAVER